VEKLRDFAYARHILHAEGLATKTSCGKDAIYPPMRIIHCGSSYSLISTVETREKRPWMSPKIGMQYDGRLIQSPCRGRGDGPCWFV
jgi:hypothetical protein